MSGGLAAALLALAAPVDSGAAAVRPGAPTAAGQQLPDLGENGITLARSRFTVVSGRGNEVLARSILEAAVQNDSFPGLPRPRDQVLIALAPDERTFRLWVGDAPPEWSIAVAFPKLSRVVMRAGGPANRRGDPFRTLRHELAHLALHEALNGLPPRWFDEGYASVAANEWGREQVFETSIAMIWRVLPDLDSMDRGFRQGGASASWHYALAHRAVSELLALDGERGLSNFFRYWKESGSFEIALRSAYGITSDQFNKHWKAKTRRRYGALAFISAIWAFTAVLVVLIGPAVVMRRRRDRRRLEDMRRADAILEAAALAEALKVNEEPGSNVLEAESGQKAPGDAESGVKEGKSGTES